MYAFYHGVLLEVCQLEQQRPRQNPKQRPKKGPARVVDGAVICRLPRSEVISHQTQSPVVPRCWLRPEERTHMCVERVGLYTASTNMGAHTEHTRAVHTHTHASVHARPGDTHTHTHTHALTSQPISVNCLAKASIFLMNVMDSPLKGRSANSVCHSNP